MAGNADGDAADVRVRQETSRSSSLPSSLSSSLPSSVWNVADSVRYAADKSYGYAADVLSTVSTPVKESLNAALGYQQSQRVVDSLPSQNSDAPAHAQSRSLLTAPSFTAMFQNPYISVRGGRLNQIQPHDSLNAVRSLLNTMPHQASSSATVTAPVPQRDDTHNSVTENLQDEDNRSKESSRTGSHADMLGWVTGASAMKQTPEFPTSSSSSSSPSETASQLAEGTLRAYRDLALDEAVELHEALRYWSNRWERPLLSWLEAGPTVWFSKQGYDHHVVGQKVTQIQAVLARRCAAIGDLQQHLLRSGWQRGVSAWGFLGDGGEWAAVTAFDGSMAAAAAKSSHTLSKQTSSLVSPTFRRASSELSAMRLPKSNALPTGIPQSNVSKLPSHPGHHNALYYADVFVRKQHGGNIFIDDPALAEWSVDAIWLVRKQLARAANGRISIPYQEHWNGDHSGASGDDSDYNFGFQDSNHVFEHDCFETSNPTATPEHRDRPVWATFAGSGQPAAKSEVMQSIPEQTGDVQPRTCVSDLSLMAKEVSSLLDIMDEVIALQRARRLDKLKPPNWMTRNWYVTAIGLPSLVLLCIELSKNGYGLEFFKFASSQIITFFRDHVQEPIVAIFNEIFKGPEKISDRDTRNVVVTNLKLMIKNWLDENYPTMDPVERTARANSMDMSLIEARKAESVRSFYEINNVIRMSFIEAQFLKKEMMNALVALDDMQSSNNMNMNLAAVTPAVLVLYMFQRLLKFVRYALFKVGKSKEETYISFRNGLLEMERLVVMRNNPPPIGTLTRQMDHMSSNESSNLQQQQQQQQQQLMLTAATEGIALNSDDLGMLMLHIHELRTILWRDRRRFSQTELQSLAEDLSELAGERGAVRVSQQLQIITRMARTYRFLQAR